MYVCKAVSSVRECKTSAFASKQHNIYFSNTKISLDIISFTNEIIKNI